MTRLESVKTMIGKRVVVHSAPTAWIGTLEEVYDATVGGTLGVRLSDACLWVTGDTHQLHPSRDPEEFGAIGDAHVEVVTAIWPMRTKGTKAKPSLEQAKLDALKARP